VAVLPAANGACPADSARWWLYEDNENSRNSNNRGGWIGGTTSDRNTRLWLCAVDGDQFRAVSAANRVNFALLALGPACPAGSITIDRYVDDEDTSNRSASNVPPGSATATVGGRNTNLRFCWFLNTDTALPVPAGTAFPNLGGSYGVFGAAGGIFGSPYPNTGWVYTDDEDRGNRNSVTVVPGAQAPYRNQWLGVGANTTMRIAQVR
jgi:hypothetical protein